MIVESNLRLMEQARERYWLRYPGSSAIKLHLRAVAMRHTFHVLPGESILELGAGSGLWTEHLSQICRHQNPISAAVFNKDYTRQLEGKALPNVTAIQVERLADLPAESFDYVVGTVILCHEQYARNLRELHRLLKPGGQILFFEANHWNPQVFIKNSVPLIGRIAGHSAVQAPMRKYKLMKVASEQGYTNIEIIPFDIIHPLLPKRLISTVISASYIVEHAPVLREICGTLYIWARKPGGSQRRVPDLTEHESLFDSTSVVVPCHNEEMNVPRLIESLLGMYGRYIHEIIIVNDNSKDRTADVTREIMLREPRVRLVDRKPPNGVGRALKDGYAAATGRYILTMDSDFVLILPEFRDLFDAIARGREGAIGSRFSYDSMLVNYPFAKILANRGFHVLANLLLPIRVRDLSNNLKLFRADILRGMEIEQPHFAANAETGLKAVLAGYDIEEVPISWINRDIDMGQSSFKVAKVAPGYFRALMGLIWRNMGARQAAVSRISRER